jgi:hypothetical protein
VGRWSCVNCNILVFPSRCHDSTSLTRPPPVTAPVLLGGDATGKMDTGHYTSYIRHEGRWYLCDDASVSVVPEAVVSSGHKAYMAFYQRCVTLRQ